MYNYKMYFYSFISFTAWNLFRISYMFHTGLYWMKSLRIWENNNNATSHEHPAKRPTKCAFISNNSIEIGVFVAKKSKKSTILSKNLASLIYFSGQKTYFSIIACMHFKVTNQYPYEVRNDKFFFVKTWKLLVGRNLKLRNEMFHKIYKYSLLFFVTYNI